MKEHYKKLVHFREKGEILNWKMNCGYKNYCVKTSTNISEVTCPKCLKLLKEAGEA